MKNIKYWSALAGISTCLLAAFSANAIEYNVVSSSDYGNSHSSFPPSKAFDGSTAWSSRWAANNSLSSNGTSNLIADLGSAKAITEVGIAWGVGDSRAHRFEIRTRPNSTDSTWTKIYSGWSSGNTNNIETYDVTDINAQQVRIKVFENDAGSSWTNITEVKIYGGSSGVAVPGRIEAEDFDRYYDTSNGNVGGAYRTSEDVDIQPCGDSNCGYNVGWTAAGEWLEYDINVATAGNYEAKVRLATPDSGKRFSLLVDGNSVTGNVTVDNTTNWQLYYTETVSLGNLSAGSHTLRFYVVDGRININWIDIQSAGGGNLDPSLPPSGNFDLSQWKITLPTSKNDYFGSGGSAAAEIQPDQCSNSLYTGNGLDEGFEDYDYFYTGSDGAMVFVTPLTGGAVTTNTSYVRSELRELYNWSPCDSDGAANWAPSGKHVLRGTLRVTDYETSDPQTVVGQIHAKESSYALVKLQWDGPNKDVRAIINKSASSGGSFSLDFGLIPGTDEWSYIIELEDDTVTISVTLGNQTETRSVRFGEGGMSTDWLNHVYYFKAGNYAQADKDSGGNFEVRFTELSATHSN